jgi:hypothetical protein
MFSCTRVFIFFNFWSSKRRSGLDPHPDPDSLEMLDPNPNSMFPDPPLWYLTVLIDRWTHRTYCTVEHVVVLCMPNHITSVCE